jgi:hypothetical protein
MIDILVRWTVISLVLKAFTGILKKECEINYALILLCGVSMVSALFTCREGHLPDNAIKMKVFSESTNLSFAAQMYDNFVVFYASVVPGCRFQSI